MIVCAPLFCQEASVLLGGVHAGYADSVTGTAGTASLRLSGYSSNLAGILTGSLSKFSDGEWVTQVSGYGTALLPVSRTVSVGASIGGDANKIEGDSWNGQTSLGLLGALSLHSTLVTAGLSIGVARTVYDSTIETRTLSGRVQQRLWQRFALSGGITAVSSDTIRYADVLLELTYVGTKLRASAGAGIRSGDLDDDPWGHGYLEYSLVPRLIFELNLGRYPQSLVGFTDGLYVTAGIRLRLAGGPRPTVVPVSPVEITGIDDSRVRIQLRYTGDAATLEIAGEWNGWLPVALDKQANGLWSAELLLDPGIYKYAIIVDGTTWTVPDGVAAEPDDFGGEVATLVVKADGRTD